jgi:hypothetical protein
VNTLPPALTAQNPCPSEVGVAAVIVELLAPATVGPTADEVTEPASAAADGIGGPLRTAKQTARPQPNNPDRPRFDGAHRLTIRRTLSPVDVGQRNWTPVNDQAQTSQHGLQVLAGFQGP